MKNTTPSGTRVLSTSRPLGRIDDSIDLAHRIGQCRDLLQPSGNFLDPLAESRAGRSRASVRPKPGAAARSACIGLQQMLGLGSARRAADCSQPGVFLLAPRDGQLARRRFGPAGRLAAIFGQIALDSNRHWQDRKAVMDAELDSTRSIGKSTQQRQCRPKSIIVLSGHCLATMTADHDMRNSALLSLIVCFLSITFTIITTEAHRVPSFSGHPPRKDAPSAKVQREQSLLRPDQSLRLRCMASDCKD